MKTLKELILEKAESLGSVVKVAEYFGVSVSTASRWTSVKKPADPNLTAAEVIFAEVVKAKDAEIEELKARILSVTQDVSTPVDLTNPNYTPISEQYEEVEVYADSKGPLKQASSPFGIAPISDAEQDVVLEKMARRHELSLGKPVESVAIPDAPSSISPFGVTANKMKPKVRDGVTISSDYPPSGPHIENPFVELSKPNNQGITHDVYPVTKKYIHLEPSEEKITRDLMILFPAERQLPPQVAVGILGRLFNRNKMRLEHNIIFPIPRARNDLAERFMKSDCEWSFWVDSDLLLPCGDPGWFLGVTKAKKIPQKFAGLHAIDQLRSRNKSLIGGVYSKRVYGGDSLVANSAAKLELKKGPQDKIIPVDWLAAGCMLVHRTVYEDIMKSRGDLAPNEVRDLWGLFDLDPTPPGFGEDIAFCARARKAGHQPYLDMSVMCAHVGNFAFLPEHGA